MRVENIARLGSTKVKKKNHDYIVMYFLLRDLREAINTQVSGYLLDVGCGNKPYFEWYSKRTTASIGTDVVQSNRGLVDVICEANKLPFEGNTFDTVLSTQVMEHVFDHNGMISESFRVLKPGGKVIFTIPFFWELHEEPYDFFRFTKYGLKELFTKHGFEIEYIKANGGKWATTFQMFINTVYTTFRFKTARAKLMKIFFLELRLTWLLNHIAIWMDKRYFDEQLTLNYLIVAKKPAA